MSTQENNFSRREQLRRKALAGIAALLMGASLISTGGASAHNIDVKKARELARDYARQVRDESGGKYRHYSTRCRSLFANHNHYARCEIEYQNASDKAKGVYTCKESVDFYMAAHLRSGAFAYAIYANHASSTVCGGYARELRKTYMDG